MDPLDKDMASVYSLFFLCPLVLTFKEIIQLWLVVTWKLKVETLYIFIFSWIWWLEALKHLINLWRFPAPPRTYFHLIKEVTISSNWSLSYLSFKPEIDTIIDRDYVAFSCEISLIGHITGKIVQLIINISSTNNLISNKVTLIIWDLREQTCSTFDRAIQW